jgi:hypothetical protein
MADFDDDQRPNAAEHAEFDRQATERDPRYPSRKAACEALESHINQWINDYEFDDGEGHSHSPNDFERLLIHDAFAGLTGDEEYMQLDAAWRALCGPADAAAAGRALHGTVLAIVSELARNDPHTDTSAGRVLQELAKAVEAYETTFLTRHIAGVKTPDGEQR